MVDIDQLRLLIMEDQYPTFTDEQLAGMAEVYNNIYKDENIIIIILKKGVLYG